VKLRPEDKHGGTQGSPVGPPPLLLVIADHDSGSRRAKPGSAHVTPRLFQQKKERM